MMTLNQLASALAHAEGKKHQASIGDIRELLKLLVEAEAGAIVDAGGESPVVIIRSAAMEMVTRKVFFGGGSGAKRGEAKVSKEDKVKSRRDGKVKCIGRIFGRKDVKMLK